MKYFPLACWMFPIIVLNLPQLRTTRLLTQSIMPKTNMIASIERMLAIWAVTVCIEHLKIKRMDGRIGASLYVKPMAY